MKIVLLKDSHVGKKGEVKSLPDPRGNYLARVGLAELYKEKVVKTDPEKKAVKKDAPAKKAKIKTCKSD